jgi:hypothetical protein
VLYRLNDRLLSDIGIMDAEAFIGLISSNDQERIRRDATGLIRDYAASFRNGGLLPSALDMPAPYRPLTNYLFLSIAHGNEETLRWVLDLEFVTPEMIGSYLHGLIMRDEVTPEMMRILFEYVQNQPVDVEADLSVIMDLYCDGSLEKARVMSRRVRGRVAEYLHRVRNSGQHAEFAGAMIIDAIRHMRAILSSDPDVLMEFEELIGERL